jgi:hypothetical protein
MENYKVYKVNTFEDIYKLKMDYSTSGNNNRIIIKYQNFSFDSLDFSHGSKLIQNVEDVICFDILSYRARYSEKKSSHVITQEKVVSALKFICENPGISYSDAIRGLMELGVFIRIPDIWDNFDNIDDIPWYKAIKTAHVPTGALIIANLFSEYKNHMYTREEFFDSDGPVSAWEYIRNATNDNSYTKENIQKKPITK